MQIDYKDGTTKREEYDDMEKLLKALPGALSDQNIKKIIIYPAYTIPSRKRK